MINWLVNWKLLCDCNRMLNIRIFNRSHKGKHELDHTSDRMDRVTRTVHTHCPHERNCSLARTELSPGLTSARTNSQHGLTIRTNCQSGRTDYPHGWSIRTIRLSARIVKPHPDQLAVRTNCHPDECHSHGFPPGWTSGHPHEMPPARNAHPDGLVTTRTIWLVLFGPWLMLATCYLCVTLRAIRESNLTWINAW